MPAPAVSETWHVLDNGILVSEARDLQTGQVQFHQLQGTRPVTPDDLRRYDGASAALLARITRWGPVLAIGLPALRLLVVVLVLGFVLAQFDGTAAVGGGMFWIALPLAVVLAIVLKVLGWRLTRQERVNQEQAGLTPGMVDEIAPDRARELIETHGVRFTQQRAGSNVPDH